jgi:hypothetical protein
MQDSRERTFLRGVLQNDMSAVVFCESLFRISQTLDDLIDRDKPVADSTIHHAFFLALIDLPSNPFYRANDVHLRAMMASALQDWKDSVDLEREGDRHGKTLAYVLRDQLTSVVVQVAGIVGGYVWMQEVSVEIRRFFHDETLVDYIDKLNTGDRS